MGRKPLASAIKKRNGAYEKNPNRENKAEPKPPKGRPVKSELVAMDPVASKKWDQVTKTLKEMGVLSKADADLLELFCINWSMYCSLVKKVAEGGCVVTNVNHRGEEILSRSPYSMELAKIADRQMKLLSEFGLTPGSRQNLIVMDKADENSPFDKWIERGGLN